MKTFFKLLFFAFISLAGLSHAQKSDVKVVYHMNSSDNATATLRNIQNHLNADPKAKIIVVTHGAGIDFLLDGGKDKNGNPYDIPVQQLAENHKVQFRVCNNTLESRSLSQKDLLPEATIVPSGVAEVARLQAEEGYAYLKP